VLGTAEVLDVQEVGGEIVHLLGAALPVGETVQGRIDAHRRRDYTEQHTADHVITGVIHRKYGFENVGFHMGAETTTIDLSGYLSPEELGEMEAEANAAIRANLPIYQRFPSSEELRQLDYRSKKELTGTIRLIEIPGVDLCACCGTHLASTGGLGLIKIVATEKLHGGLRFEFVAGERAWSYVAAACEENRKNSVLLSAKPLATSAGVERVLSDCAALKQSLAEAENRYIAAVCEANAGAEGVTLFAEGLSPALLQRLTNALMERCGGTCAVFSGADGEGYRYCIGSRTGEVRELVRDLNSALGGRGGGRANFAQGSVSAAKEDIVRFLEGALRADLNGERRGDAF
jgi:alanyl-tRNA synthetase